MKCFKLKNTIAYALFLVVLCSSHAQIKSVIAQSYANSTTPLLENIVVAVDSSDITLNQFLWFNAYESSSFPEVQTTKKYFFVYGTDHSTEGGGIFWGEGNNLDCSDFAELGLITGNYQAETPYLLRVPNDVNGAKIYLYYHTLLQDPQNTNGIQETRLIKTTGGQLHTATWIDEGNPLGVQPGENHTGYCKVYPHPEDGYRAIHLTVSGTSAEYKFSIGTDPTDLTTRDGIYDLNLGIEEGREVKASFGTYFKLYGESWFIGTTEPETSDVGDEDKNLIIARTNSDFQIIETIVTLNQNTRNYDALIIGNVAHVYFQDPSTTVKYGTVDLSFLQNYL